MEACTFDQQEAYLVRQFLLSVRNSSRDLHDECRSMEENLDDLFRVFSRYPSILDQRSFNGEVFCLESLIDALEEGGCSHLVLLPTKIVAGRSFLTAKFNFFGFLMKISNRYQQLTAYHQKLQQCWESVIFSLLIEEIYQVIIDGKSFYDLSLRRQAAIELIHLWEYRVDRLVQEYSPILIDLWRSRRRIAPVFGTMLGTVELLMLSSQLSRTWHQFLCEESSSIEVVQALEEFMFGLTFEQVLAVRSKMRSSGLGAIDRTQLKKMLDRRGPTFEFSSNDPRELYRFYHSRAREVMKRLHAGLPGPKRTLEELFLAFLILQRKQAS